MFLLKIAKQQLWREWRSGQLYILTCALLIAVTIASSITLFIDRLHSALVSEASQSAAADLVITNSHQIAPHFIQKADNLSLKASQTVRFTSMAFAGDNMHLLTLKAVDKNYPLSGAITTSLYEDQSQALTHTHGPSRGNIWLSRQALFRLKAQVGDTIDIGQLSFKVERLLVDEPDRSSMFTGYGPLAMLSLSDIEAMAVLLPGSRARHRLLISGENISSYQTWFDSHKTPSMRLLNTQQSRPSIATALSRAESFLMLGGTLGVILAGVGIALAARRYCLQHQTQVAVLKTLGMTPRQISQLYSYKLLMLGLITSVIGLLCGYIVLQFLLTTVATDIPQDKLTWHWKPWLISALTGLLCLFAFAAPPIQQLKKLSPTRVLAERFEPQKTKSTWLWSCLVFITLLLLYTSNLQMTAMLLVSVLVLGTLLAGVAWLMLKAVHHFKKHSSPSTKLGIASLHRHHGHNTLQVMIFSLTLMLLLTTAYMRTALLDEWQNQLPEQTPNHFIWNLSETQVTEFQDFFTQHSLHSEPLYPVFRGRLTAVNGVDIDSHIGSDQSLPPSINRNLNMTWSETLPVNNQLTSGQWWDNTSSVAQQNEELLLLSVESGVADEINVKQQDVLTFSIAGSEIKGLITNIRKVQWDAMTPNFFMIFSSPPKAPYEYLTSFYIPPENKTIATQLLKAFPNLTLVEVGALIKEVQKIMQRVVYAVELVFILILIAGITVLLAGIQASMSERIREHAILRALGANTPTLSRALWIEFGSMGLIAGLLAAAAAQITLICAQYFIFDMDVQFYLSLFVVGSLLGFLGIGALGVRAGKPALNTPPITLLRSLS